MQGSGTSGVIFAYVLHRFTLGRRDYVSRERYDIVLWSDHSTGCEFQLGHSIDFLSGIISGCESSVWTEGFFTEILRG